MRPLLELGLAAAMVLPSTGVLAWSARSASAQAAPPVLPVRGNPIRTAPSAPDPAPEDSSFELLADGTAVVPFEALTLDHYDPPELRGPDPALLTAADFPPEIAALHRGRARVRGYPIVVQTEERVVQSLVLARFPPGCCFGAMPVPDEWIEVAVEPDGVGVTLLPSVPVTVEGVMDVGEELGPDGLVSTLYRMSAGRVVD